jgi:hypothetical protein
MLLFVSRLEFKQATNPGSANMSQAPPDCLNGYGQMQL